MSKREKLCQIPGLDLNGYTSAYLVTDCVHLYGKKKYLSCAVKGPGFNEHLLIEVPIEDKKKIYIYIQTSVAVYAEP